MALIWVWFNYPLIIQDSVLIRDDVMLLGAVSSIHSFGEYWVKLIGGTFLDIQPIRDLTFFINIYFDKTFGYGGFHIGNLILGFFILIAIRKILILYRFKEEVIFACILLVGLHPILNSSMAWISNRKHLLSMLFIIWFLIDWKKSERITYRSVFFLTLSLLSQPITIFIPFIVTVWDFLKNKKRIFAPYILMAVLSFLILGLNYWFYSSMPVFEGRNAVASLSTLGLYVLRLGRVIIQLLFPVSLSVEYDHGSILNLIGAGFTVVAVYLLTKIKNIPYEAYLFMLFALSTLFPVIEWHVRDPYLLFSLFVFIPLFCLYLSYKLKLKWFLALIILLTLPLVIYSFKFTRMWENDLILTKTSYETEGGVENLIKHAAVLSVVNPTESYKTYMKIKEIYEDMDSRFLIPRIANTYFDSKHLSDEKKLQEYEELNTQDPYNSFFKIKFLKKMNKLEAAKTEEQKFLKMLKLHPQVVKPFVKTVCTAYPTDCRELGI